MYDKIWINVNLMTMARDKPLGTGDKSLGLGGKAYGLVKNGAIAVTGDVISWVGLSSSITPENMAHEVIDCHDAYLSPGLIDCHSHLIYGGERIDEFERRMTGVSYEEIAKGGGGIMSTVRATRNASPADLFNAAKKRLMALMKGGVTTAEIKSGYGLDLANEIKMLEVAAALNDKIQGVDIMATCLAAHSIPPEFKADRSGYIRLITDEILPLVAKRSLASFVDGFCEDIAFSKEEMSLIFTKAKQLGLGIKLHAEQLSNQDGAKMAAQFGAISVDHLEHLTEDAIQEMAKAGVVASLLPGAFYTLKDKNIPPIDLLRKYNVPMAVATDSNPGSSPALSLSLMINMAVNLFALTPEEAFLGVTKNAAQALGLNDRGVLEVGKKADFALWGFDHPAALAYFLGSDHCLYTVKDGKEQFGNDL